MVKAKGRKKSPPSYDTVWEILQENAQGLRELRESQKETDRQMKESQKEYDRRINDYNKQFGDFTNRFGEVIECMVSPNLHVKFRELGYYFPRYSSVTKIDDFVNNIHFEIDVLLENGDIAMLVEIKTNLKIKDIKSHIDRLGKMRKYADLHNDNRAFLGAVAGVVIAKNVKQFAFSQGLFVVEPSGETFNITPPEGKPGEW